MIVHITHAKVVGPYSLELTFDDGLSKRVNLRNELYGVVFEPLRDSDYFAQVSIDPEAGTVAWPNGADFAPDYLYHFAPEALAADTAP
jgi:hypothetical protein